MTQTILPQGVRDWWTIFLRVPETLKKRVEEAAKIDGQSVNMWANEVFEEYLETHKDRYNPTTEEATE